MALFRILLVQLFLLSVASVAVGAIPGDAADCTVDLRASFCEAGDCVVSGGICEGDCTIHLSGYCSAGATCTVNDNADCIRGHCVVNVGIPAQGVCWGASCLVNIALCTPNGGCEVNAGSCGAECTINVAYCDWTGECFLNASEGCNGACTIALLYACTDPDDQCLVGLRTQDGSVDLCHGATLLS